MGLMDACYKVNFVHGCTYICICIYTWRANYQFSLILPKILYKIKRTHKTIMSSYSRSLNVLFIFIQQIMNFKLILKWAYYAPQRWYAFTEERSNGKPKVLALYRIIAIFGNVANHVIRFQEWLFRYT